MSDILDGKYDFAGQLALVTGASRGIGAAISDAFAVNGATVFGTATSESGAADIEARLQKINPRCKGQALDVNDAEAVANCLVEINEVAGAPTILVNNAGITRDQILMRMKEEDWDDIMATNLRSVFRLSKACMRGMMKARGGRIINISSVVASIGNPGQANYAAAKAGMIGFSKSLAREIGSRGITVNVISPGFIDTDMTRALEDTQRDTLIKDIPLQRLGDVDDIAAAALFLASAGAAYITGHTLHVNGGMFMS